MSRKSNIVSNFPKPRASTRHNKRAVITYLSQEVHTRIKVMAVQRGTTLQALSEEAFQLLFNQKSTHSH